MMIKLTFHHFFGGVGGRQQGPELSSVLNVYYYIKLVGDGGSGFGGCGGTSPHSLLSPQGGYWVRGNGLLGSLRAIVVRGGCGWQVGATFFCCCFVGGLVGVFELFWEEHANVISEADRTKQCEFKVRLIPYWGPYLSAGATIPMPYHTIPYCAILYHTVLGY